MYDSNAFPKGTIYRYKQKISTFKVYFFHFIIIQLLENVKKRVKNIWKKEKEAYFCTPNSEYLDEGNAEEFFK